MGITEEEYYASRSDLDMDELMPYLTLDDDNFEIELDATTLKSFEPNVNTGGVIVDGLPRVPAEKVASLKVVLCKLFNKARFKTEVEDILLPPGQGFAFVCCNDSQQRQQAVNQISDFKLANKYLLKVRELSLLKELQDYNENSYDENKLEPGDMFKPRPEITSWLSDKHCRDQFVVRYGEQSMHHDRMIEKTNVSWSVTGQTDQDTTTIVDRDFSPSSKVSIGNVVWSPQGTFLACQMLIEEKKDSNANNGMKIGPGGMPIPGRQETTSRYVKGVKLFGGNEMMDFEKFEHKYYEYITFSPCESYFFTQMGINMNRYKVSNPQEVKSNHTIFWSIRSTSEPLKKFPKEDKLANKFQIKATIQESKSKGKNLEGQTKKKQITREIRGRIVGEFDSLNDNFNVVEENGTRHVIQRNEVIPLQDPNKFKWSHDGNYVAHLGMMKIDDGYEVIKVYELPSLKLLDRASIPAKGMVDFEWSPGSNHLAYYVAASSNQPALIKVMEIPSKKEISSRKVFDITNARLHWQGNGEYLCACLTKQTGKSISYILLLYRLNEPEVPVEMIDIPAPITSIAWEPNGDRFAVAYGLSPQKQTISFYSMMDKTSLKEEKKKKNKNIGGVWSNNKLTGASSKKKELTKLFELTDRKCNHQVELEQKSINWSPAGSIVVIANYDGSGASCSFEFYDVDTQLSMASRTGDRVALLQWDPSGRVLCSRTKKFMFEEYLGSNASRTENGYDLWSFQGVPLAKYRKKLMRDFSWRPRPIALLSPEEKKNVIKDIKKYEKIFDQEDKERKNEQLSAVIEERKTLARDFMQMLNDVRGKYSNYRHDSVELRGGFDEDDESNYETIKTIKETIISEKILKA